MPTYKRFKLKNGASRRKRTQKKYRKAKSRKVMRGGKPVTWNQYNKERFSDNSISSHARDIGREIFNENAILEEAEIPKLAEVSKSTKGLTDTDYNKYFKTP